MLRSKPKLSTGVFLLVSLLASACSSGASTETEAVGSASSALTAQNRLDACAQDPRVLTGLMSARICAGGDIFARETFGGNGRTCTSCHPIGHNTTIDGPFVSALFAQNPNDPLFVFKSDPALAALESESGLFGFGNVLENVDGFEDPTRKFILRAVPHTLSLSQTISADATDPKASIPPVERTGWSGDGSPEDGSLRSFLQGAIKQHYTKTLARVPGVDFRVATPLELDLTNEFQRSLGRTKELDLTQVNLFDPVANLGRQVFVDPNKGRCNFCHLNAGANFQDTGKGRNFDTEIRTAPAVGQIGILADGTPVFDGGFGGIGLAQPNMAGLSADPNVGDKNAFGNGTFNTPSLIEAADTGPFFHNNAFFLTSEIESAVFFYIDPNGFGASQAAKDMLPRFGTPIAFSNDEGNAIGRFLRALNVAFNLDLAKQRLSAARTLYNRFGATRADLQIALMQLADTELNDASTVLAHAPVQPFYPVTVDQIGAARAEIAAAIASPVSSRGGHISNAVSRVETARNPIGANINYGLGAGNLMF
ncbi:MAG TPA: hypothetical protein VER11_19830 [Polyangiaceae bacterium]|nr:hypothetical protein [Polyangiaceae bacterium]